MNPQGSNSLVHESGGAESSDHSLLNRVRAGSQDAATQIYLRYAQRLHALTQAQCSAELARQVDIHSAPPKATTQRPSKASCSFEDFKNPACDAFDSDTPGSFLRCFSGGVKAKKSKKAL